MTNKQKREAKENLLLEKALSVMATPSTAITQSQKNRGRWPVVLLLYSNVATSMRRKLLKLWESDSLSSWTSWCRLLIHSLAHSFLFLRFWRLLIKMIAIIMPQAHLLISAFLLAIFFLYYFECCWQHVSLCMSWVNGQLVPNSFVSSSFWPTF